MGNGLPSNVVSIFADRDAALRAECRAAIDYFGAIVKARASGETILGDDPAMRIAVDAIASLNAADRERLARWFFATYCR